MTRGLAITFFPIGFALSIIDAWLSIQSVVGMLNAESPFEYIVGIVVGFGLTAIAVCAPLLGVASWPFLGRMLWRLVLALDVATSVMGAIWYGVMRQDLRAPINFAELEFDPGNWQRTSIFVAFVLLLAGACVLFGRALKKLSKRRDDD